MISRKASVSLAALLLLNPVSAAPITKRSVNGPAITSDFPDPSIIQVDGAWYAFGTSSVYDYTNVHVQFATSSDFKNWDLQAGQDAMPDLPAWVDASKPEVWAPDVNQLADGSFVMYFSATTNSAGNGAFHCVGTATSNSPLGPYTPNATPFVCPTDQGGAIDASGFLEQDGTRYVVYKIDGNSLGHGGSCNNGVAPLVSTPIMIQQVASDGVTAIGSAQQILDREDEDGPLVEAPSLIRDGSGTYVLFYSSGCYLGDTYDVKYATSSSPTSGFVRAANNPLLATGSYNLIGPGGLDGDFDNVDVAFHAISPARDGRRFFYTGRIAADGSSVTI